MVPPSSVVGTSLKRRDAVTDAFSRCSITRGYFPCGTVAGLLTTFNEAFDRVAMLAVRQELVEAQAGAVGLPLVPVMLPYPCPNEV